jgi:hypothetical protein
MTVVAGLLIALITLFTSYAHVDLPGLGAIPIDQQIGVPLLLASLATLVGVAAGFCEAVAQLATRRRSRDQSDRAQEAALRAEERFRADREGQRADRERNRAAEERERALRRAQRQARCNLLQFRYLLAPTPANTRSIADLIALLEDYGDLA